MKKAFLKMSLRQISKQRAALFITLGNLVVGLVCLALIVFYMIDENQYDTFNVNANQIYRITHHIDYGESIENSASCPFPIGHILKEQYPDKVKNVARLFNWWGETFAVKNGDLKFNENQFAFADSSLFDIFHFDFIAGHPNKALDGINKIVLTQSAVQKYFGSSENVLGKILRINDQMDVEVSAIVKDLPSYSHFHFKMFCSLSTFESLNNNNIEWWWCNPAWTYVRLNKNVGEQQLQALLNETVKNNVPENIQKNTRFSCQPLTDIHLTSKLEGEIEQNANTSNNYILMGIALIIIIIAFVNYLNMMIVNQTSRTKEISIQKVLGSGKGALFGQLFIETLGLLIVALLLSLVTLYLILPFFNQLAGKMLTINIIYNGQVVGIILFAVVLLSLLLAYFPNAYANTLSYLALSKNKDMSQQLSANKAIQVPLLVFQFVMASVLIIGCCSIIKQVGYMQSVDVGFDKSDLLVLNIKNTPLKDKFQVFKDEVSRNVAIKNITFFECIPGKEFYTDNFYPEGMPTDKEKQLYHFARVEKDYVATMGLKIVSGRDFSDEYKAEPEQAILINEAMVRLMGWTNESAIGKKFYFHNQEKVIGVIRDYNYHSLHEPIGPLAIDLVRPNTGQYNWATNYIGIKFNAKADKETIKEIETAWNRFAGNFPFDYFFLDDNMKKMYVAENKLIKISVLFSIIAIILSCIGLYNMIRSITRMKVKEIGIRKVNGATIYNILTIINGSLFWHLLISFLIAIPLAFLIVAKWLQNFAYKTELSWWIFALAGLLALGIALLTVSWQSWRAATRNPVEALRSE